MNEELYNQLRQLGVYPTPARDIARRVPDDEDTEDVIVAYKAHVRETDSIPIAVWRLKNGILLTGGLRPSDTAMRVIRRMPFPVLRTQSDSYGAASTVHTLTVKTRPKDKGKISLIRDLIAKHVDVARIIHAL